ncbi:MAG: glycosyl hydrolase, partial [Bacteroidota bacterium]|nr:glycosyl hydrolase [Bacteroidota bacterium]
PNQDHMPLDVLLKLEEMAKKGATIIGQKPVEVPYLNNYSEDNAKLADIATKMWEGNGQVISKLTAREVLSTKGIQPDFSHENPNVLDYIHRQNSESDIYFIRNKSDERYSGLCSFRVKDMYPELWDPSSGKQFSIAEFSNENGRISFHLDLKAGASLFVVFKDKKSSLPATPNKSVVANNKSAIEGSWRITFTEGWGAPSAAEFENLISWTDSDIEGIKYFSGTASYHKTISINEEDIVNKARIELDLGEVRDVAEVFLNGKSAGIVWTEPFRVDITELAQAGENELKIEVVNQWVNRLSGDMLLDPEDRFCRTNQPYITSDDMNNDNWVGNSDETYRVQSSGLLGPVHLITLMLRKYQWP